MSVEQRLRSGLTPDEGFPAERDAVLLRRVVGRVEQRRRIRRGVILAVAAILVAVAAATAPWALLGNDSAPPPVTSPSSSDTDTTSTETSFQLQSSPIDGETWSTRGATRARWLESLAGSGLESFGPAVYQRAFAGDPTQLEIRWGEVILRAGHLGDGAVESWTGTADVSGHEVTFSFPELGDSTYRWRLDPEGRLHLTLLSAEGPDQFGAPAEVFLRMALTSYPFTKRLGY